MTHDRIIYSVNDWNNIVDELRADEPDPLFDALITKHHSDNIVMISTPTGHNDWFKQQFMDQSCHDLESQSADSLTQSTNLSLRELNVSDPHNGEWHSMR